MQITYKIAMAASMDAGNRAMRKGGRSKWSVADQRAASATFHRLMDVA